MNNANYDRLKDALGAICGIALFVTFFLAVGTAGAVECDNLTLVDGVKRMAVLIGIMAISVIGIAKTGKDDDELGEL